MKMNKSVLQRGIIFILCICILFSICPVYAFAAGNQKEKIVRIGVPDQVRIIKVVETTAYYKG